MPRYLASTWMVAAVLAVAAVIPSHGEAAEGVAPVVSTVITGTPESGQTLTAVATALPADLPVLYAWARCLDATCEAVEGSGSSYGLTDADVGRQIRVTATVSDGIDTAFNEALSGVVQPAPTPPPPPPPPPPPVPPTIDRLPAISGTPLLGEALTSSPGGWTPPTAVADYRWFRCEAARSSVCASTPVRGETYTLLDGDVGSRMRVRLRVTGATGTEPAVRFSAPTAVVEAPPPPPGEPPPPPAGSPPPVAPGESGPRGTPFTFTGTTPDPSPTANEFAVRGETRRSLRVLKYFPVVRIRGFLTSSGAKVQVLSIRAPKNVRISVRCIGRGCPRRSWARTVALVRARAFEGTLPAGVKLVISVRRKGAWIGKYTSIRIHRGKAPTRTDRCLYPGRAKPRACPAPA